MKNIFQFGILILCVLQVACEGSWQVERVVGETIPQEAPVDPMELPFSPYHVAAGANNELFVAGLVFDESDEDFAQRVRVENSQGRAFNYGSDVVFKIRNGTATMIALGRYDLPGSNQHIEKAIHFYPYISLNNTSKGFDDFEVDAEGNLLAVSRSSDSVLSINPEGYVASIVGVQKSLLVRPLNPDNLDVFENQDRLDPGKNAIYKPTAVTVDDEGAIYIGTAAPDVYRYSPLTGYLRFVIGRPGEAGRGQNNHINCAEQEGWARGAILGDHVSGLTHDSDGNVFLLSGSESTGCIHRYDHNGLGDLFHVSGDPNGVLGQFEGGTRAIEDRISRPLDIAMDRSGFNLYFTDSMWNAVRYNFTLSNRNYTIAGGDNLYEGEVYNEPLNQPSSISVDSNDNVYFVDHGSRRVLKINPNDGTTETVARGMPSPENLRNNDPIQTRRPIVANEWPRSYPLEGLNKILIDDNDIMFILNSKEILSVPIAGDRVSQVRGSSLENAAQDERYIDFDLTAEGHLMAVTNQRLIQINLLNGRVTLLNESRDLNAVAVDRRNATVYVNNNFTGLKRRNPQTGDLDNLPGAYGNDITVGSNGALYLSTRTQIKLYRPATNQSIVLAGTFELGFSGDGGDATEALLNQPDGLTLDDRGNLIIADKGNHRLRYLNIDTGVIRTLAGYPWDIDRPSGYSGDRGRIDRAKLNEPISTAFDSQGNLYVGDSGNDAIRKINLNEGTIEAFAGLVPRDRLNLSYRGLLMGATDAEPLPDTPSDLLVSHLYEGSIWKIDTRTQTIAPLIGIPGGLEDGGLPENQRPQNWHEDDVPALDSRSLFSPTDIEIDRVNNRIFIAETESHTIRMVTMHDPADSSTWSIRTRFGEEHIARQHDNEPILLNLPSAMAYDPDEDVLYVMEEGRNSSIRVCSPNGGCARRRGLFSPEHEFEFLVWPQDMFFEDGNLWVADTGRHRIVRIEVATGTVVEVAGNGSNLTHTESDSGFAGEISMPFPQKLLRSQSGSLFIVSPSQIVRLGAANTLSSGVDPAEVIFRSHAEFPLPAESTLAQSTPLRLNTMSEILDKFFYLIDGDNGMLMTLNYTTSQ